MQVTIATTTPAEGAHYGLAQIAIGNGAMLRLKNVIYAPGLGTGFDIIPLTLLANGGYESTISAGAALASNAEMSHTPSFKLNSRTPVAPYTATTGAKTAAATLSIQAPSYSRTQARC